jgi:hypothetical protein
MMKHMEKVCDTSVSEADLANHSAWKGQFTEEHFDQVQKAQEPYSYLLGKEDQGLTIAWKNEEGSISKAVFELVEEKEEAKQVWFFQNRKPHYRENIDELIPLMLHCDKEKCRPLS